ncbi:C-C motif chemokine 20 [Scleropages formosus]|uniref:Chemokine interleukin-8-like domain-containing protein n=1 Tax=Scleropages formosus TaxID=113540 RepID=A0A8C9RA41_SCLFO|nr:C-C motif chemokine 20-like [Scleropages formosus]
MMTQKNSAIAVLLFCCILSMLSSTVSTYGPLTHACCVKYTRKPLPFHLIKGYIEQSSLEVCRIDAIIFFTVKNKKLCASPEDEWVKATLICLSDKLNAMASNGTLEISEGRQCQPLKMITN